MMVTAATTLTDYPGYDQSSACCNSLELLAEVLGISVTMLSELGGAARSGEDWSVPMTLVKLAFRLIACKTHGCSIVKAPRFANVWNRLKHCVSFMWRQHMAHVFCAVEDEATGDGMPTSHKKFMAENARTCNFQEFLSVVLRLALSASDEFYFVRCIQAILPELAQAGKALIRGRQAVCRGSGELKDTHQASRPLVKTIELVLRLMRRFFLHGTKVIPIDNVSAGGDEDLGLESQFISAPLDFNGTIGHARHTLSNGCQSEQRIDLIDLTALRSALRDMLQCWGPARRRLTDKCEICALREGRDNNKNTVLCDGCDGEFHLYCLAPPLAKLPKGDWLCPSCKADSDGPQSGEGMSRSMRYNTALLLLRVSCEITTRQLKGFCVSSPINPAQVSSVNDFVRLIGALRDYLGSDTLLRMREGGHHTSHGRTFALGETVMLRKDGNFYPATVVQTGLSPGAIGVRFNGSEEDEVHETSAKHLQRFTHDSEFLRLSIACLLDHRVISMSKRAGDESCSFLNKQISLAFSALYGSSLGLGVSISADAQRHDDDTDLESITVPRLADPTSRAAAIMLFFYWQSHTAHFESQLRGPRAASPASDLDLSKLKTDTIWIVLRAFCNWVPRTPAHDAVVNFLQGGDGCDAADEGPDHEMQSMVKLAPNCPAIWLDTVLVDSSCGSDSADVQVGRELYYSLCELLLGQHGETRVSLSTNVSLSSVFGVGLASSLVSPRSAEFFISELCFRDLVHAPQRAESWHRLGLAQWRLLDGIMDRTLGRATGLYVGQSHTGLLWGGVISPNSRVVCAPSIGQARAAEIIESDRVLCELARKSRLRLEASADIPFPARVAVEADDVGNAVPAAQVPEPQSVLVRQRCLSCLEMAARLWRFRLNNTPHSSFEETVATKLKLVQCLEHISMVLFIEATQDCGTPQLMRERVLPSLERALLLLEQAESLSCPPSLDHGDADEAVQSPRGRKYARSLLSYRWRLALQRGKVLRKLVVAKAHINARDANDSDPVWHKIMDAFDCASRWSISEDARDAPARAQEGLSSSSNTQRHYGHFESLCRLHRLRLQLLLNFPKSLNAISSLLDTRDTRPVFCTAQTCQLVARYSFNNGDKIEEDSCGSEPGTDSDCSDEESVACFDATRGEEFQLLLPSEDAPLGLQLQQVPGDAQSQTSIFVRQLEESYAVASGIQVGDQVVTINGYPVCTFDDVSKAKELWLRGLQQPVVEPSPLCIFVHVRRGQMMPPMAAGGGGSASIRARARHKVSFFVKQQFAVERALKSAMKLACHAATAAALAASDAARVALLCVMSVPTHDSASVGRSCSHASTSGAQNTHTQLRLERFCAAINAIQALRQCQKADKYDHRAAAAISQSLLVLSENRQQLVPPQVDAALHLKQFVCRTRQLDCRGTTISAKCIAHPWYDLTRFAITEHQTYAHGVLRRQSTIRKQRRRSRYAEVAGAQPTLASRPLISDEPAMKSVWRLATRVLAVLPYGISVAAALHETVPLTPPPPLLEPLLLRSAAPAAGSAQRPVDDSKAVTARQASSSADTATIQAPGATQSGRRSTRNIAKSRSKSTVAAVRHATKTSQAPPRSVSVGLFSLSAAGQKQKLGLTAVWRQNAQLPIRERYQECLYVPDTLVRQFNNLRERYARLLIRLQYASDTIDESAAIGLVTADSNCNFKPTCRPIELLFDWTKRLAEKEWTQVTKWRKSSSAAQPRAQENYTSCLELGSNARSLLSTGNNEDSSDSCHGALMSAHMAHVVFRFRVARLLRLFGVGMPVAISRAEAHAHCQALLEASYDFYLECLPQSRQAWLQSDRMSLDKPRAILEACLREAYHRIFRISMQRDLPGHGDDVYYPALTMVLDACQRHWPLKDPKGLLRKAKLGKKRKSSRGNASAGGGPEF